MPTPIPEFSHHQARWFRMRRSGLVAPFTTPEAAAGALAGVQAQILVAAGVSLGNRTAGLDWKGVFHRLADRRSLVRLWGQRGTLHVYATEDWPLLISALQGRPTWSSRQAMRDPDGGSAYQAGVKQLVELLRLRGTLTRDEARAANLGLAESSFSSWGGIFTDLVRSGIACHVPAAGTHGRLAHRDHWLPTLPWTPPTTDAANVELARRYLRTYGPARVQDLAYWRGATVAQAAGWIGALAHEVAEVRLGGVAQLALRADVDDLTQKPPPRDAWPVRLLGRFDPMLLSHKDKTWLIDADEQNRVWRPAGHIEATLLVHGRIAGTWRYDRTGGGIVMSVKPFTAPARYVSRAIERRAIELARFFGQPLADLIVAAGRR